MYDKWSGVALVAQWLLITGALPAIILILVIAYHFRRRPVERRRSLFLAVCPLILDVLMYIAVWIMFGDSRPIEKPSEWVEVVIWGLFLLQIPILIMIVYNLRGFLIVAIPLVVAELWFGIISWFINFVQVFGK